MQTDQYQLKPDEAGLQQDENTRERNTFCNFINKLY
jgi:hypothetical protein